MPALKLENIPSSRRRPQLTAPGLAHEPVNEAGVLYCLASWRTSWATW
jgi:hypothetical protein